MVAARLAFVLTSNFDFCLLKITNSLVTILYISKLGIK